MRIFTAVRHSNDPRKYCGDLWSANFYPALRRIGCEVIESKVDLLHTSRFMHIGNGFTAEELSVRTRTTEQIIDEVRMAHRNGRIHCFLSYFYNSHFDPAGFDELRKLGIPSINFYCNSIYQFAQVSAIAAKVDVSWHAERAARATYLAAGARPMWVQLAADPDVYHPVEGTRRVAKACFLGQRYADRDRWIAVLLEAEVGVDIYGSGWCTEGGSARVNLPADSRYLGRRVYTPGGCWSYVAAIREHVERAGLSRGVSRVMEQWKYRRITRGLSPLISTHTKGWAVNIPSTLAAYSVCLNFSNVWADGRPGSSLIPHVRLRDFEAPMCRTCYLTGHTDEIAEFYDLGREIDTYRTPEELVDKTRFYLGNPDAAERLRDAGHLRALRDHTWKRRFEELFGKVGIRG